MLSENKKEKIKKTSSKIFISDILLKIGDLSTKNKDLYSRKLVDQLKNAYGFNAVDPFNYKSISLNVEFERLHKTLLILLMDEEVMLEVKKADLKKLSEKALFLKLIKNEMGETLTEYYKSILNTISLIELHSLYSK